MFIHLFATQSESSLHAAADDGIVPYGEDVMGARTPLTYDDYAALPEDGKHYELLAGEISRETASAKCSSPRST
jgi:hypothetical protein